MSYTYFVINIDDFIIEKAHPYTIVFKATCPVFHNATFDLRYTGSDIEYNVSLPEEYMDKVRSKMQEVFGNGPYNHAKIKKLLSSNRQFRIGMGDEE
ncbi:hypothetical protein [Pseudobutyrivibrio ruminis]|uniref:hypothetical protein n=1 Tax=Pseudobutyrivibrio ruminis TaxID=46206 RepID=UPI00051BC902|nr:hypothetical protein [Pseudobutyrivibrio ruminis]